MHGKPMIRSLLLVCVLGSGAGFCAPATSPTVYPDADAVRRHYDEKGKPIQNWLDDTTARGSTMTAIYRRETRWHDADTGEYLYTDWQKIMYTISRQGTVVALPVGDWVLKESFTYKGDRGRTCQGALVLVAVKVCAPNITKLPSSAQCEKVIKNLVESGLAIPNSAGKGGHLQPLKRLVRQRYGAAKVDVLYRGIDAGCVGFVLYDCVESRANAHVRTMMYDGEKPRPDARNPQEENHPPLENYGTDRLPSQFY